MTELTATPAVPLTVEGSAVLHQMLRVKWADWRRLADPEKSRITAEATDLLSQWEGSGVKASAAFSLLGHKGDLMLVHFREKFEELDEVQRRLRCLRLYDYVDITTSYVSVVELGLYESTQKAYGSLAERGVVAHSPEWDASIQDTLKRQHEAMRPRLYPEIPPAPFICFYPMDRRRGEVRNWYQETMADRSRMMHEHGMIGRRYAGSVRQIITGSIGFDDWEWGVDLFAEDPLVFKKLIYEMRFDEVSAVYALFGTFYIGKRLPATEVAAFLSIKPE